MRMVKLTSALDEKSIFINPAAVAAVFPDKRNGWSMVNTIGEDFFRVTEGVDEVVRKLCNSHDGIFE